MCESLISTKNAKGRVETAVIFSSLAGPPHMGALLGTATSIGETAPGVMEPCNFLGYFLVVVGIFFFKLFLLKIVVLLITA